MSEIEVIRCVDFETTGLDPKKDEAGVVEIGCTDLTLVGDKWVIGPTTSVFVHPGHHIPSTMSAIHHIVDSDVQGAERFPEAAKGLLEDADGVALCAHNSRFEQKFFLTPAVWLDTYRIALHLAPQAPGHSLQALRYWLKLDVDKDRASPPHRAGPDTYITAVLMQRMLAKMTIEHMIEVSSRPAILPHFVFGKHAMKPLVDVDTSYLHWVVDNITDDEDVLATARHHLEERKPQRSMRV
jgi:exodeoxyribonuclease X